MGRKKLHTEEEKKAIKKQYYQEHREEILAKYRANKGRDKVGEYNKKIEDSVEEWNDKLKEKAETHADPTIRHWASLQLQTNDEVLLKKKSHPHKITTKIGDFEYEGKGKLFEVPTSTGRQSKEATKNFLLSVLYRDLDRLSSLPKAQATLKRAFYKEMIESL